MYSEPWFDIKEYDSKHQEALSNELKKELSDGHFLYKKSFEILAKREDNDELLVFCDETYIIVHLTWSSKSETLPYPSYFEYKTINSLKQRLSLDSKNYI